MRQIKSILTNGCGLKRYNFVFKIELRWIILGYSRGLKINKLRKFDEGFFNSNEAKNAGDAGHRRVFLTKYELKKTSSNA